MWCRIAAASASIPLANGIAKERSHPAFRHHRLNKQVARQHYRADGSPRSSPPQTLLEVKLETTLGWAKLANHDGKEIVRELRYALDAIGHLGGCEVFFEGLLLGCTAKACPDPS